MIQSKQGRTGKDRKGKKQNEGTTARGKKSNQEQDTKQTQDTREATDGEQKNRKTKTKSRRPITKHSEKLNSKTRHGKTKTKGIIEKLNRSKTMRNKKL